MIRCEPCKVRAQMGPYEGLYQGGGDYGWGE